MVMRPPSKSACGADQGTLSPGGPEPPKPWSSAICESWQRVDGAVCVSARGHSFGVARRARARTMSHVTRDPLSPVWGINYSSSTRHRQTHPQESRAGRVASVRLSRLSRLARTIRSALGRAEDVGQGWVRHIILETAIRRCPGARHIPSAALETLAFGALRLVAHERRASRTLGPRERLEPSIGTLALHYGRRRRRVSFALLNHRRLSPVRRVLVLGHGARERPQWVAK
jgi:hypothetical protein